MSRFLLVELEPQHAALRNALITDWSQLIGVHCVTDLDILDADTFLLMLAHEPDLQYLLDEHKAGTGADHLIRRYWAGQRQPRLPEVS